MLFADDVMQIDENMIEVDQKLELWRHLESKSFRLSRTKTEFMRCQFSGDNSDNENVSLDGQLVHMNDTFRYLRSMLQSDGEIDEDICHRIRAGWVRLQTDSKISDIICDPIRKITIII
jgi:hypothetical protein